MKELEKYITDENIIFYLCRIRAKIAKRRNKEHLIHLISSDAGLNYHLKKMGKSDEELCKLFPSRRKWKKLGENNRTKNGKKLNSLEKNIRALMITIKWYRKNEPGAEFLNNLDAFILSIHKSILDENFRIDTPKIIPQKKEKQTNNKTSCRPISIFNLRDRIIICLVNKYFTDLIDDYFFENSMAFRAVKRDRNGVSITSHHDAIKAIINYKKQNAEKKLWVSECDMKKFYDTVSHAVIRKHFKTFIQKIKKDFPKFYSEPAIRIFNAYLDSYSYNENVLPLNDQSGFFENHKIENGEFEWIDHSSLLEYYDDINKQKIGIPQGGALSGLIANIVLHHADSSVLKTSCQNLLYLRYCDDMIIMHPNKVECEIATKNYFDTLKNLKLFPHEFAIITKYDKGFWKHKSKQPYEWGEYQNGNIPWIGFVGYEIHFNGDIRVRKSSLKREMTKQVEVINQAYLAIRDNNKRASDKYIEESIIHRLVGMSVGRISMWNYRKSINDLCWVNGFSELTPNTSLAIQLKRLDRNRNKHFARFRKKIKEVRCNEDEQLNLKSNRQIVYIGKPFSYYYHAHEKHIIKGA